MLFSLCPSQFLGLPFLPNRFDPLCIILQNHLLVMWDLFLCIILFVLFFTDAVKILTTVFFLVQKNTDLLFLFFLMLVIDIGYKN